MKKATLLNADISAVVAQMGHKQMLTLGDAGLPIPEGVRRIDLAVTQGTPTFLCVLKAVLSELCVEKILLAEEIKAGNPSILAEIMAHLPNVEVEYLPHEAFKEESKASRAIVRTGETTPFANVILVSGVTF